jgi:phage terminase large subunit
MKLKSLAPTDEPPPHSYPLVSLRLYSSMPYVLPDRCRGAPHEFAEQALGLQVWPRMREIFDAVAAGHRKILVRSCNGAGKTTALAALCLWKLCQNSDTIVLTTASSWTQVRKTLWGEIRKQARRSGLFTPERGRSPINDTQIRLDDMHYALGISPSIPENAMGFHAENMLIAIDEATGISQDIFDALSGNATSENTQIIMICNPIDMQSVPYQAEASGQWHTISISALEHPNVVTGENIVKGAVTRRWIEDRLASWTREVQPGQKHALYIPWLDKWYKRTPLVDARILGEWADVESDGFINMDLIKRSVNTESRGDERAIGVDIGRKRDMSVIAFFIGNTQGSFEIVEGGIPAVADRISALYHQGWQLIALDDGGIGGGVTDLLKDRGIPFHDVNFGGGPMRCLKHDKPVLNVRAEMYFLIEEELRDGEIQLLDDDELHRELAAPRLQFNENATKYVLEKKELVKRRLGRSPDRADATVLARYAMHLEARLPVGGLIDQ